MATSDANPGATRGLNVLLVTSAAVIIVAGLKAAEAVLVPLIFSAFLAVMSAAVVLRLRARRVPDTIAVPLAVLGMLFGIALVIGGSVRSSATCSSRA